jgi:hypothetical protein
LEPVGGGEQDILGDARLELERCQCNVHVGLSPFVVRPMVGTNMPLTVIFIG